MLASPVNYQMQFPNVPKRETSTGRAGESREKERGEGRLLRRPRRASAHSPEQTDTCWAGEPRQTHTDTVSGCSEQEGQGTQSLQWTLPGKSSSVNARCGGVTSNLKWQVRRQKTVSVKD